MKTKKIVALILAVALCLSLCACGDKKKTAKLDVDLSGGYPIETDAELTYWMELTANVSATASNFGETEFAKELAKRTGVKVTYLHPAIGKATEAFNLLVASGDLPDIIEHFWKTAMPGGVNAAFQNEVIVPLNDLIENYSPNLAKYLSENPDVDRMVKTDDGQYYAYPNFRSDPRLSVTRGPVIRKDWLDELGVRVPETLEEWEEMLIAFRDKKGASSPLTLQKGDVAHLYRLLGFTNAMYLENGKVSYAIYDENFKRGLETLNRWYKEGLLDKNYVLNDVAALDSNMLNNHAGATFASGGSGMGKWLAAKKGTSFDLVGAELPKIDGKANEYGALDTQYHPYNCAAISTKCETPELAAKYLDYLYSEEGHMFANFGIEGVSYNMIDGYPTYSDIIMKNPDGLSVSQAMSKYIRGNGGGPFVQDVRYIEQYYEFDSQKEALDAWMKQTEYSKEKTLPPVEFTMEESNEIASFYSDITKYCSEEIVSFIMGEKSFSEYDSFVKTVEKMGIKRAIEIYQDAYERYMKK